MINKQMKAVFLVLLCVTLWALIPVVAKLGQYTLDNHQFLFWSSLISFLVLLMTTVMKRQLLLFRRLTFKELCQLMFLGLLGTYIYYLLLYLGYKQAVGMEVLVFQYTWPILIVLFSIIILKEKLTARKTISIILGFIGVLFVLTKGEFNSIHISKPEVIILVVAGASCFALFSVLSKTVIMDPIPATAIFFFSATVASFFSMLYFSEFSFPSSVEILPVILNGVLVNGFSYVLWIMALKLSDASFLAPFTFITPVLSAIYLVTFFKEPFLMSYAIGLLCIIAGGLINSMKRSNKY